MLWRKGYETKKVGRFDAPEAVGGLVWVGISGLDQVTDAELWMRLLDKDFPDLDWGILALGVDLEEAIAPSRFKRVVESRADWGFEREFCYCVPAGFLMVGPPTEDAWEEFAGVVYGSLQ